MSDSSPYPKPFLTFKESTVLFVDEFGPSGLKWAKLEKSPGTSGLPDAYKLVDVHGEGPCHFRIYWCQYTKDAAFSVSLAKEADLMFTPKMTGCTFAVGMPARDGNMIVGPANVHNWTNNMIKAVDEEMNDKGTSLTRLMELNAIRLDLVRARQLEMLTGEPTNASNPSPSKVNWIRPTPPGARSHTWLTRTPVARSTYFPSPSGRGVGVRAGAGMTHPRTKVGNSVPTLTLGTA